MNPNFYTAIPNLEADEYAYIQSLTEDLPEDKLKSFLAIYSGRRQKPEIFLLLTIVGFFGIAGIQRFIVGQLGMGILYILTGGLCLIGTIYDIINYRRLTFDFNRQQAVEALQLVKMN